MEPILKTMQVIILPSIKESPLYEDKYGRLHDEPERNILGVRWRNIYIVSDAEIKEGDWYWNGSEIFQMRNYITEKVPHWRKIEATTDSSLKEHIGFSNDESGIHKDYKYLPQIPESFVEEYVKSNGTIKEVQVEIYSEEIPAWSGIWVDKVKTNSDNTIILYEGGIDPINSVKIKYYGDQVEISYGSPKESITVTFPNKEKFLQACEAFDHGKRIFLEDPRNHVGPK